MKTFFEVQCMTPTGRLVMADVAFTGVRAISDFNIEDVSHPDNVPEDFINNVKSIMLAGDVNYFCTEERRALRTRIEREWGSAMGVVVV